MSAAESCTVVPWCDQPPGHEGNHVRLIGLVEPTPWSNVSAVLVTIEAGPAETDPLPVVGFGSKLAMNAKAPMTWSECATLARLLADVERRYA